MGLDATVRCRCWQDGKTPPPPCPIEEDEDGHLQPVGGAWSEAFEQWMDTACEHEDMELACEHISNWTGYRLLQQALGEAGWEHFVVLQRTLPEANGGITSAEDAATCLRELDRFIALYKGRHTVLVDVDTGTELRSSVDAYGGVFVLDGSTGFDVGFDAQGMFLVDRETDREVFRALRVRQHRRPAQVGEVLFRLEDLDTGRTFDTPAGIPGEHVLDPGTERYEATYPQRLAVEQRDQSAEDFAYVIRPLRVVFEAAVATGNPVRWC